MAIELQTKSDEITRTKDEMRERTTTLDSDLMVIIKTLEQPFLLQMQLKNLLAQRIKHIGQVKGGTQILHI